MVMRIRKSRPFPRFIVIILFLSAIFLLCAPASPRAQLNPVSEDELAQISGQAGITRVIGNSGVRVTVDSYRFSDTDHTPHNWIELNDVSVDDGQGGPFSIDTPSSSDDFNTLDVATDELGRTYVFMNISTHVDPRTYTIGSFVFCGQDLGSIRLENVRRGASDKLIIGARDEGFCGITMEYDTELTIDSLEYAYNTQPDSLNLSGIHIAGSAAGDPETPSSWSFEGKFKIGDLQAGRPMTVDVGTSEGGGTSVFYNVPMEGAVRVEDVDFGGKRFGPCAMDGITVHHLGIQIPGN